MARSRRLVFAMVTVPVTVTGGSIVAPEPFYEPDASLNGVVAARIKRQSCCLFSPTFGGRFKHPTQVRAGRPL